MLDARDLAACQSPGHTPKGAGRCSMSVGFFHARRPEKDATGGGATKTFPAVQIPVSISRGPTEEREMGGPGGIGLWPGKSMANGLGNCHNGRIKATMAG
jgi:hypothetical protein